VGTEFFDQGGFTDPDVASNSDKFVHQIILGQAWFWDLK
jgi:hypothetical protein